jgi:hypothetical protein
LKNHHGHQRCALGLLLALLNLIGGVVAAAQSGRPVPDFSRWWDAPPKKGDTVRLLWRFDEAVDDEALDAMLTLLETPPAAPGLDDPAAAGAGGVKPVLSGNTRTVPGGRFGHGLALGTDGTLVAKPVDLVQMADQFVQSSLEFFVRLDRTPSGDSSLLATRPGGLRLGWKNGQLTARSGQEELLLHPTAWTTGCWYHVALQLKGRDSLELSVNGQGLSLDRRLSPALDSLMPRMGNTLTFGGGLECTLDEVLVTTGRRLLYAMLDPDLPDPGKERKVPDGPPFLSTSRKLLHAAFDDATGQPGVRGGALAMERARKQPVVLGPADALRRPQGSLEFWFQPLSWNNFYRGTAFEPDFGWHNLLQVRDPKDPSKTHGLLSAALGAGGSKFMPGMKLTPFHPGSWVHVVVTWGRINAVYINGVPQEFSQIGFNRNLPTDAAKGGWELIATPGDTLLDEVIVYPHSLHPNEVWNAWRRYWPGGLAEMRTLSEIEADFEYAASPWTPGTQNLRISINGLPVRDIQPATAFLAMSDAAGNPLLARSALALDEYGAATTNLFTELPFGTYTVAIETLDDQGGALARRELEYHWKKPEWHGNMLGRDRGVPPPWTPIQVTGDSRIGVWGRTITLGTDGLPSGIETLDRQVLAAPVRIHGETGGKPFDLRGGVLEFTEKSDDRLRWQSDLPATADGPASTISAWMEYDGLMVYTVRLHKADSGTAPVVDRLWVDIPLQAAETSQLIANGSAPNFRASHDIRFLPAGTGSVWNSRDSRMQKGIGYGNFLPQVWVGGDEVGLSVSGDNDKGWTPDPKLPAQEILRTDDGTVLFRMNVITRPVTMAEDREFTFILLPTPSKPMPAGWRGWNRSPRGTGISRYENVDDFDGYAMTSPPGGNLALAFKLEPHDWETAGKYASFGRVKAGPGNPVLKYINYSWPALGPSMNPWIAGIYASGRLAWTPEVEDYYVWIINEYLRRGLIDGIYIDDASMGRNLRLDATAYEWENPETGKMERRSGFNSMGFRRFLQRVYKVTLQQGKTPRIMPHMTWCFELPALSFCDAMLNGEDRDIVAFDNRDYITSWSRDELRIMGNSPKWGVAGFWKWSVVLDPPGTPSPRPKLADQVAWWTYWQGRAGDAWLPQHDLWYFWREGSSAGNVMTAFGMADPALEFIPYWKSGDWLEMTDAASNTVMVGAWRKPGRALVMISNTANEDQTVTLTPSLAKLFGAGKSAAAWRDADPAAIPPPKPMENPSGEAAKSATTTTETISGTARETLDVFDDFERNMDGTPEDKTRQALALHTEGTRVTLLVRKHDYRLLLLE